MSALTPKPCPECSGTMIPFFSPEGAFLYCLNCQESEYCPKCEKTEEELKAERESEFDAEILGALQAIAGIAGNLPDERLETASGPNDAAMRGGMVVSAREIARDAIAKWEARHDKPA